MGGNKGCPHVKDKVKRNGVFICCKPIDDMGLWRCHLILSRANLYDVFIRLDERRWTVGPEFSPLKFGFCTLMGLSCPRL